MGAQAILAQAILAQEASWLKDLCARSLQVQ